MYRFYFWLTFMIAPAALFAEPKAGDVFKTIISTDAGTFYYELQWEIDYPDNLVARSIRILSDSPEIKSRYIPMPYTEQFELEVEANGQVKCLNSGNQYVEKGMIFEGSFNSILRHREPTKYW